jgi:chaperonin cofactor prefoldin
MGSVLGPLLVKNLEGNMIGHEDQLIEYLIEHYNDIWDKDDEFEGSLKRENSKKTKVLRFMIFFPGGKKVVRFDPDRKLFPILERMASSYNLDLSQYTIHDGHNVQIDNDRDMGSIDGMCVTLRIKEVLIQSSPVAAHRRASVRITKLEMDVPTKLIEEDANRPQSVRKHIQVSTSKSARLLSVRNVRDLTPLLNSMKHDHERRKSVTGLRYVPNMGKLLVENEEEYEKELDNEVTGLENQLKIFDDQAETLTNMIKSLKEERNELQSKLQLLWQNISITTQDIQLMRKALEHLSLST